MTAPTATAKVTAGDVTSVALSEDGYTGGPGPTSKYGAWYGINPGDWCAMFLSWCGDQAGRNRNAPNPYAGIESPHGFAYTPAGFAYFQAKARTVASTRDCIPGDLVFYDYGMGRISHVGLVITVDTATYRTVEGNTSGPGGRTGNTVATHDHSHGESVFRGVGRPDYSGGTGTVPSDGVRPGESDTGAPASGLGVAGYVVIGLVIVVGAIVVFTQAN